MNAKNNKQPRKQYTPKDRVQQAKQHASNQGKTEDKDKKSAGKSVGGKKNGTGRQNQNQGGGDRPKNSTPTLFLPYVLNDAQREYVKRLIPTVHWGIDRHATPHSHPLLALERRFAEEAALDDIGPNRAVLDIGGNPNRHYKAGRTFVFSCCPLLTPEDVSREAERVKVRDQATQEQKAGPQWCNHKVEDCSCINYLALLSVHSLYYLDAAIVCRLVNQTGRGSLGLWAVLHNFTTAPNGTFANGEATWEVRGGMVTMLVAGNLTPYCHPDASWVFNSGGYYDKLGYAMTWTIRRTVGDTTIVKFLRAPTGLRTSAPLPMLQLNAAMHSHIAAEVDLRGVLNKGDKIIPTQLITEARMVDKVLNMRDYLVITRPSKIQLSVPKGLIDAAAFWSIGKVRDSSNFTLLLNHIKREVVKYNVPPDVATEAVLWASSMGFVKDLDAEISAAADMSRWRWQMKLYNQLAKFDYYGLTSWRSLVAIGVFTISLLLSFISFRVMRGPGRVMFRNGARGDLLAALRRTRIPVLINELLSRVRTVVGYLGNKFRKLLAPFTLHVPGTWVLPMGAIYVADVCAKDKAVLTPMHAEASVRIYGTDHCEPKFGHVLAGPSPATFTPIMPRSCVHNEHIAVVNRACMERIEPEPGIWATIPWDRLFNMDEVRSLQPVKPVNFQKWLARFPKRRRGAFVEAWNRLRSLEFDQGKYHHRKAFVKKEHTLKFDEGEVQKFDPRLIQGAREEYQVATGPILLALSNWLKKVWSLDIEKQKFIVYTSGYNAHELGELISKAIDWLGGDPLADEDDASRWDANIGEQPVRAKWRVYTKYCRVSRKHMVHIKKQKETVGHTPHGVKYKNSYTVKSGDGDTSGGNTTQNGGAHAKAYLDVGIRWGDFIIFVLGDDILILVRRLPEYQEARKFVEQILHRMGLRAKFQSYDHIHLAEFCSGRFWPSDEGYTFGPKIGRALTKMYRCIHHLEGEDITRWVDEVTYANSFDHHHIPILRSVNEVMMSRMTTTPLRRPDDDHKIHAIHPVELVPETWEMMHALYGLTQETIEGVEAWIRSNFKSAVLLYSHPILDRIIRTDLFERYGAISIPTSPLVEDLFRRVGSACSWLWGKVCEAAGQLAATFTEKATEVHEEALRKSMEQWITQVPERFLLMTVVITPLWEEAAKKLVGTWKFIIFEMALYHIRYYPLAMQSGLNLGQYIFLFTLVRAPAVFMHWAAGRLPYKYAVLVHGFFNFVCYLQAGRNTTPFVVDKP